jgi:hypothetical protein
MRPLVHISMLLESMFSMFRNGALRTPIGDPGKGFFTDLLELKCSWRAKRVGFLVFA